MKNVKTWFSKHRIHFLIWALFILYECLIVRLSYGVNGALLAYAIHYFIVITIFYCHACLLLPWALKNKSTAVWKLTVAVVFELTMYISMYYIGDTWLKHMHVTLLNGDPKLEYTYCVRGVYRAVYFLSFSSAYYFLVTYNKERKRTEELEKQKLNEIINRQRVEQELTRAQNAFLKAQINPHFLFNTLDFIYHNVRELSPGAADAIISLSEMMRYAIDADKMGEFILIGDEIDQVQNLQYLNRLKKSQQLPLRLIYGNEIRHINFIPLVLLTLAENVFKHGSLLNNEEAIMEIYIKNGLFIIETDNLSSRQRQSVSNRTGLLNIEQRLKHAYGDDIYFNYYHDSDHFKVQIKVPVAQLGGISAPLSA